MEGQPKLLFYLYHSATGKYRKFRFRIDKAIQQGRFQQFSRKRRSRLLHRLEKLRKRIHNLYLHLKLALAGSVACASLSFISPTEAQAQSNLGPFEVQERMDNPLRWPFTFLDPSRPTTVDWDGDGDFDLVVGEFYNIRYFENTGTNASPAFVERTGSDNPFEDLDTGIAYQYDSAPQFADFDGDGDLDLFVGTDYGGLEAILYFKNEEGTLQLQPAIDPWDNESKTGNPFHSIFNSGYEASHAKVALIDFDSDGDLDAFIGQDLEATHLYYYRNDLNVDGTFVPVNLNIPLPPTYGAAPQLVNFDGDADLDIITGAENGSFYYYVNDGSNSFDEQAGPWNPVTHEGNPLDDFDFPDAVPHFVDLDDDGDLDVVIGRSSPYPVKGLEMIYLENTGNEVFEERTGFESPIGGILADGPGNGSYNYDNGMPAFIDVDNDGDMDFIFGDKYPESNDLKYHENINGEFFPVAPGESPFMGNYTTWISPTVVDINGDGFEDVIVGQYEGDPGYPSVILYLNNQDGTFAVANTEDNPFSFLTDGPHRFCFIDVDEDGDFDAFVTLLDEFVGHHLEFYRNTGTATAPVFTLQDESSTPANFYADQLPLEISANYHAADINGDGKKEIIYGDRNAGTRVFEYNPSGDEFNEITGDIDAFQDLQLDMPMHFFIDFDGDGDQDFFAGVREGQIQYVKNENPAPALDTEDDTELEFDPGDEGIAIATNFALDDPDNDGYVKATIKILGYEPGRDFLILTRDWSESFKDYDFDEETGEFFFVAEPGFTSGGDFESAFEDLVYDYVPEEGEFGRSAKAARSINKTVRFQVFDKDGTIPAPLDFVFSYVNQAPQLGSTASDVTYTTPSSAVVINNTLTISDVDDLTMASATISITNFQPGQDNLEFVNQNGITGSFSAGSGVLTLTGGASVADYETALRSVRYRNMASIPNTTPRTISFVVNDGESDSAPEELDIDFNFTPTLQASSLTVSYGGVSVSVDNAIIVTDIGDAISNASIYFSSGYQNGQDVLTASPTAGITALFNAAAGAMVLNGPANRADFEAALRSITYNNVSGSPSTGPRTIEIFIVDDIGQASNAVYITVNYTSQQPPVLASSSSAVAYTTGQLIVDNALTVSDPDDTNIESATVTIQSGFASTEDVLAFTPAGGITGSYSAATGVLSLSGSETLANYQAALRSVTYENTNAGDRNKALRNIVFQVNDGSALSNTVGTTVSLPNQVPAVANSSTPPVYVSGAVVIADQITLTDGDNATFQAATVQISTAFQSGEDELIFADQNNITGSYDPSTGVLSLGGNSSKTNYQAALRSVQYRNNNTGDRNKTTRVFTFSVHDGVMVSNTINASVTLPNQIPAIANSATPPLVGFANVPVADQLILTDNDNATFQSAAMIITGGLAPSEDQLLFNDQNGITGTYTAASGTLQLTGSATKDNYQTALRSVLYRNTATAPSEAPRIISITVNDGLNSSTAATVTLSINRPPAITDPQPSGKAGEAITIDVASIVNDPDNNIDLNNISSITITVQPESGAAASIVNGNLVIDYSVSFDAQNFKGIDHITITVCDVLGRCTTQQLTITIDAPLEVFNAVAPNGNEKNRYLFLRYVNPQNKVSIFNRWGDKVFEVRNYNNNQSGQRFEGLNDNGNELPSGTYFYKIEYPDGKNFTGFLSLKR